MAAMKQMRIRRDDVCATCHAELVAGTEATWHADERVVRCLRCGDEATTEAGVVVPSARSEGVAGRSAQVEYDRRSARERVRAEAALTAEEGRRRRRADAHPVVGRLANALSAKPELAPESPTTRAWRVGAEGERRVAEALADLDGVVVLHDRQIPGTRANIDHVVVAASSVFVVDAKRYSGRIEIRDEGGLFRVKRRLVVDGRDRTALVDGVRRQVEVVRAALSPQHPAVEVHGMLCFVDGRWGLGHKGTRVGDVTVVSPRGLARRVGREARDPAAVDVVAGRLRSVLSPA
jgi:hypothetical protein